MTADDLGEHTCPHCSFANRAADRVCAHCGEPTGAPLAAVPDTPRLVRPVHPERPAQRDATTRFRKLADPVINQIQNISGNTINQPAPAAAPKGKSKGQS